MTVLFTKRAQNHYYTIHTYINAQFGEIIAAEFNQHLSDLLRLLVSFPEIGRREEAFKQVYCFQLTKQTRVIYRIKGKQIIVLALFDVRQDPGKKFSFL